MRVKRWHQMIGLATAGWAVAGLGYVQASNVLRYQSIMVRNAFNLHTPEPPKPPEPPPPSVAVKLTGITALFGVKRCHLLITEAGKQPTSEMMEEGVRRDAIEVVTIDDGAGTVKIMNSGREITLNFDKDGVKAPVSPAPTVGAPAMAGIIQGLPAPMPGGVSPASIGGNVPGISSGGAFGNTSSGGGVVSSGSGIGMARPMRTGGLEGSAPPAVVSSGPTFGSTPAVTVASPNAPGNTLNFNFGNTPPQPKLQPNWPPEQPVTLEESHLLHEALRLKHEADIKAGSMPPFPGEPLFK